MTEPRYRIRNWKKFQYFRDRRPPWIRLYGSLLDNIEWWSLSGDEAKILINLWLLAREDVTQTGLLPPLYEVAFRLRVDCDKLSQNISRLSQWLEQVDTSETDTETEADSETDSETDADKKADPKPLGSRAGATEKPTACMRTQEPNAEPAGKRTETARPATTASKPVSPDHGNGTGQHRAIPGIRLPRPNIERIMALTQDLPVYRAFWIETERRLLAAGHGSDLHEWLQKIDDCQNPVTRATKGYGEELKQPAKWLYRQVKDVLGQNMPRLPKKEDTNVN